jgi:hexosaminidase
VVDHGGEVKLDGSSFSFVIDGNHSSALLKRAFFRYARIIFDAKRMVTAGEKGATQLLISVSNPDEALRLSTSEKYELRLTAPNSLLLDADTFVGVLRGLETFSQLVTQNSSGTYLTLASITDQPRFPHREFLLDSARYYFAPDEIEHVIDAMEYRYAPSQIDKKLKSFVVIRSKFNVLHWHFIDGQSFPVASTRFPLLSQKGAFLPNSHLCPGSECVYTPEDVHALVSYAKDRGIRVVAEVDTPGHAKSWGRGYPNATVHNRKCSNPDLTPLNPVEPTDFAFTLVSGFIQEFVSKLAHKHNEKNVPQGLQHHSHRIPPPMLVYQDEYLHLGGDETDISCYQRDSAIAEYMREHNLTARQLMQQWVLRIDTVTVAAGKQTIHWEDCFNIDTAAPPGHASTDKAVLNNTVIQVWKNSTVLHKVATSGYRGILSAGWYIDSKSKWEMMYAVEPFVETVGANLWLPAEKARVIGGQLSIDSTNPSNPTNPVERHDWDCVFHALSIHKQPFALPLPSSSAALAA